MLQVRFDQTIVNFAIFNIFFRVLHKGHFIAIMRKTGRYFSGGV